MQILPWMLEYPCATRGVEDVMLGQSNQKDLCLGQEYQQSEIRWQDPHLVGE